MGTEPPYGWRSRRSRPPGPNWRVTTGKPPHWRWSYSNRSANPASRSSERKVKRQKSKGKSDAGAAVVRETRRWADVQKRNTFAFCLLTFDLLFTHTRRRFHLPLR